MTVLSPFDEAIRDFANAQHLLRIKKLLVYACTQHWETDPDRLAQYNLHYLIETLIRLAPTVDQLKTYLSQVTQTLSKPAEYLLIANTIVQSLQRLYTGPISSAKSSGGNPQIYWQIAQTLEQETEHLRIRKLLVLICRNYWETDLDVLLTISVPDLLTELHQLTQSFDHLKAVVSSVVETTSKPLQYRAIAESIINACRSLYISFADTEVEIHTRARDDMQPLEDEDPMPSSPTYIIGLNSPSDQSDGTPQPETALMSNDSPTDEDGDEGSDHVPDDIDIRPIPVFNKSELYDLRLEVMKYTVPLLSKHLLFLAVYVPPGQASEEEQAAFANDPDAWATLKARDLDDLILAALKQYPTLSDLSMGLQLTVQSLTPERRYTPVADAIVQAVKTLIVKHGPPTSAIEPTYGDRHDTRDSQGENTLFASPSTVNFHEQAQGPQPDVIRINPPGSIRRRTFSEASTQATSSTDETAMLPEFSPSPTTSGRASYPDESQSLHSPDISEDETFFDISSFESSATHSEV
ncbi:MAG: hypothetical protein AAFU78_01635 [Cyanobacteria bacterium J06633_2]